MTTNPSSDAFLKRVHVSNEVDASKQSLVAALKRNRVYASKSDFAERPNFRDAWMKEIINRSGPYRSGSIPDSDHIQTIAEISDIISISHRSILHNERLRFGTSQKAFNLYLKFLWRLGKIPVPPHCPIDGIVLRSAKIREAWTKSDCAEQYKEWISRLTVAAGNKHLSDWEYDLWNKIS